MNMRSSSQCEINTLAWHEAKRSEEREALEKACRRKNCQGESTDDHTERGARLQRIYPDLSGDDVLLLAMQGRCGPNCKA
jgi:hypothetical protein